MGLPKDLRLFGELVQQAAAAGSADALFALGGAFFHGEDGFAPDPRAAFRCVTRAVTLSWMCNRIVCAWPTKLRKSPAWQLVDDFDVARRYVPALLAVQPSCRHGSDNFLSAKRFAVLGGHDHLC